jgi:hypothetical protein
MLETCARDNVQHLAIMACERYGATLAMCSEVCQKVEKLAKRKHISHVLDHIGAKIGFAPSF